MNSMFAFDTNAKLTISEQLSQVCDVIVSAGLGIRGGEIAPGGNNVKAGNAAAAIKGEALDRVHDNQGSKEMAMVDLVRAAKKALDAGEDDKGALKEFAQKAVAAKKAGWETDAKPVNWDVNGAGAKRAGYREPTGVAGELSQAFKMGEGQTKSPAPKTPTKA